MTRALARVAAGAEVPVFVARGTGSGDVDALVAGADGVRRVDSPRAATVLLVAGCIPASMEEALDRVHDQLAHPRATVWWTGGPAAGVTSAWPEATVVETEADVVTAVRAVHRALITGARVSERPRLPDVEATEWRSVGPYGQGGKAMTGGTPYGRPMAGRGDDRDGLSLDVVPLTVGPFFPALPAGLALRVTFAGDVVHQAEVTSGNLDADGVGAPLPDAFGVAGRRIAAIERARAGHHLRWLARLLHLYGLDALARRALGLREPADVSELGRRLGRGWVLGRATAGVGVVTGDDAHRWGGTVARAAGHALDARTASDAYAHLGFEPVIGAEGDVRARWRQHVAEAVQSLELAARAGDAEVELAGVELPGIAMTEGRAAALGDLVNGMEWGDAVATIASLDLTLDAPVVAAAPA